jgi:hypothetical protein
VIEAFEERINDWYLEPVRGMKSVSGHFAFAAMAVNCLLIDMLSQFAKGLPESDGAEFKLYLKNTPQLAKYAVGLAQPIDYQKYDRRTRTWVVKKLKTVADVLWVSFRCGILHQAHAPLYCRVDPGGPPVVGEASGRATYAATKTDCPCVTINPWILFADLETAFRQYVADLKNRDARYDPLRTGFKDKCTDSFGIDIRPLT